MFIKTYISNSEITLIRFEIQMIEISGPIKPKSLIWIVEILYGHICLREENHSFINNYIIKEL
jgi:hypothetical protein